MRVLVATDGTLPVEPTVRHLKRLYQPGDEVLVLTAINLPRRFLKQLASLGDAGGGSAIADVVDAAGPALMGLGGGDRVAERLAPREDLGGFDEVLERYYRRMADENTAPLVTALKEVDIPASPLIREARDRTAATIIEVCRDRSCDLLVIGTTGMGRFEGRLGSTGTKLVRGAPTDVLLVRVAAASAG